MKISKLFHWLYAILMLLPFAFFVPSVLYYAFNDNATMQSVEVPKTETIAVDFNQIVPNTDMESNQYFTVTEISPYLYNISGNFAEERSYLFSSDFTYAFYVSDTYLVKKPLYSSGLLCTFRFWFIDSSTNTQYLKDVPINGTSEYAIVNFAYNGHTSFDVLNRIQFIKWTGYSEFSFDIPLQIFDLTKMFGNGNEPTIEEFNQMFPLGYYDYVESDFMQITYDTGETEQLVENTSIINYAWESIWDLPLFNWCKVSFVAVPFTYITGLFGLAASNSFNYVFTYFASMSIIWLVFDVIMYVPLLVHRWLDKGIVE